MANVSVVVPVYNAEQYIERCMNCLLGQTLQDMELIFVDDCSTDQSLMVLEAWQQRYPKQIKVVHSEINRGPGGARNLGIQAATGQYIGFMDCDDVIDQTMYEKLFFTAMQDDLDIVDCAYYEESIDKSILSYMDDVTGNLDCQKKSRIIAGVGYAVTKIFRTSILQREDMKIRENVIYEDLDFLIHAVILANKVGNVKEVLYVYKNNGQSVSKRKNEQKKFTDMLAAYDAIEVLREKNEHDGLEEAMHYAKLSCLAGAIGICLLNQDNPDFLLVNNLKELKSVSKDCLAGWENNLYVHSNMPEESRSIIAWFAGLKI